MFVVRPLFPLPCKRAMRVDAWTAGPNGATHELGLAPLFRLERSAIRAWRLAVYREMIPVDGRAASEIELREMAARNVTRALWSAAAHKIETINLMQCGAGRTAATKALANFLNHALSEFARCRTSVDAQRTRTQFVDLIVLAIADRSLTIGAGPAVITPRAYARSMSAALGVAHPFDDGSSTMSSWAEEWGWLPA